MQEQELSTLALTGGYPLGRAIVIVENGEPWVTAFILDKGDRLLRLHFHDAGEIIIETGRTPFLEIDSASLRLIRDLAEEGRDLAADLARCRGDFVHLVTHPRPIDLHETLA
jgi:hypothetical protein